MSALIRAMYVATDSAKVQEDALNKLVDKKESQLDKTKKLNHALDVLESARSDEDGHAGFTDFTRDEKNAATRASADAGVDISNELSVFDSTHSQYGGHAYLESEEETDSWDDDRNKAIDGASKKIQRAVEENQDATGMLDFKMNLAMNDLSKAMQDAQGVQQIRSALNNALISRA